MNPIDRHVGSRLRLRRIDLRLSRRDLATALRVPLERIKQFEAGEERIGASLLWQVSEKLGVSVHYFFVNAVIDPR
jgi:transcriptional regulator with XRE-family HTH domain